MLTAVHVPKTEESEGGKPHPTLSCHSLCCHLMLPYCYSCTRSTGKREKGTPCFIASCVRHSAIWCLLNDLRVQSHGEKEEGKHDPTASIHSLCCHPMLPRGSQRLRPPMNGDDRKMVHSQMRKARTRMRYADCGSIVLSSIVVCRSSLVARLSSLVARRLIRR